MRHIRSLVRTHDSAAIRRPVAGHFQHDGRGGEGHNSVNLTCRPTRLEKRADPGFSREVETAAKTLSSINFVTLPARAPPRRQCDSCDSSPDRGVVPATTTTLRKTTTTLHKTGKTQRKASKTLRKTGKTLRNTGTPPKICPLRMTLAP